MLSEFLASVTFPGGWGITLIAQRQKEQAYEIETLQFLVSHLLTKPEFDHLNAIAQSGSFVVNKDPLTERFLEQIRDLLDRECIGRAPGQHFTAFEKELKDQGKVDVKRYFEIVKAGNEYRELQSKVSLKTLTSDGK